MLAEALWRKVADPAVPVRKAALPLILGRVVVQGKTVKLIGEARGFITANTDETGVIGFMAGWRPQRESNPCLHRERVVS
jgi:hypothetical protein